MLSLLLSILAQADESRPTPPPNVVWIVADDAGWADFGFQGSAVDTPRLDALAAEGVRFEQAYVSASVCSPSRAGLLTGRYQQRFGHEFNLPRRPLEGDTVEASGLALTERTAADLFAAAGYATGAIGKWHLGAADRFHPTARGFEHFYGLRLGSRSFFPLEGAIEAGAGLERGREPAPEVDYVTDAFAAEAAAFIEGHAETPFFLYVSFTAVHTPMHALERDLEGIDPALPDKRRKLLAMTRSLDRGVGTVLDALEAHGLVDRTLVVFVNDNGGATDNASDNGPLRGRKGDHFEGGLRVPLVVRFPGRVAPGLEFDRPVSALDLLPTSLAAAGIRVPANLDGVDLLPGLAGRGDGAATRRLFWRRGPIATVRDGGWKLIRIAGHPPRLFDLRSDPGERVDRAASEPERVEGLLAALAAWERGLEPPRWRTADVWRRRQVEIHTAD